MSNETPNKDVTQKHQIPVLFISLSVMIFLLFGCSQPDNSGVTAAGQPAGVLDLPDVYEELVADAFHPAEEYALAVRKIYSIPADAVDAPAPNQSCYGSTDDPSTLQWLLDAAQEVLDGQDTLFRTDIEIYAGSTINYYLDETIFAITWQQVFDNFVYTISEVKVAHPSQFRRHLVDNEYDSKPLYTTLQQSEMLNAVVVTSGDYYRARKQGITVYEGTVHRFHAADVMDSCFVDVNGDLILMPADSFETIEEAQAFVDENQICFSIAFGPILVNNGEQCEPANYAVGEVNKNFPRTALCQRDELHYAVVVANGDGPYWEYPTIHTFAKWIAQMGFEKAYSMDGGNTGAIVMNDEIMNPIRASKMRATSDCLYFATALPEDEQ